MATTATVGSRCVNYPILIQEGSYRKFVAWTSVQTQMNTCKYCVFNWRASFGASSRGNSNSKSVS